MLSTFQNKKLQLRFRSYFIFSLLLVLPAFSVLTSKSEKRDYQLLITATATPLAIIPTGGVATATVTQDNVTYYDLLDHFEKVSSSVLTINTAFIALFSLLAGLGAFFGFKSSYDVMKLNIEIQRVKEYQEKIAQNLEEAELRTRQLQSRLIYIREIRDNNSEVRIRAIQQLGHSNDISAVSLLCEVLENDKSSNVKIEAAYGLGRLLKTGDELETLGKGITTLVETTRDKNELVRREAIEALDYLICNNIDLPVFANQRLREIVNYDTIEDVKTAAKLAIEHVMKIREGNEIK
jgi:hypothetical protein